MRRKYRQDRETGKLVEITAAPRSRYHFVRDDITPFVSIVDGSIVNSQSDLRAHNDKNNVVSHAEYGNQHEVKRKEFLDRAFHGKKARASRIEAIKHAVEKHRNNEYSTFQNYVDDYR